MDIWVAPASDSMCCSSAQAGEKESSIGAGYQEGCKLLAHSYIHGNVHIISGRQ